MSTHTSTAPCPNCDGEMDTCINTRPFETTSGQCLNCGFEFYPHEGYVSLDDLNIMRADVELPPLDKLPPEIYQV